MDTLVRLSVCPSACVYFESRLRKIFLYAKVNICATLNLHVTKEKNENFVLV